MAIAIEKENVFKRHLLQTGINLFLGAGFSYDAKNKNNDRLPLGNELKKLLIKHFGLEKYSSFSLAQLSQVLKSQQKGDFHRFLGEIYKVKNFIDSYKALDKVLIKNIITINIDDLVEKIYESQGINNLLYDVAVSGNVDNQGINLYKLHGSITYTIDKELLFTPEELSILFTIEHAKFYNIALQIASKPTLFWGTKMEDSNVLSLLSQQTLGGAIEPQEKWILITPSKENDITAEYFKGLKFNIIRATGEELLAYLENIQPLDEMDHKQTINNSEFLPNLIKHFSSNYIDIILSKEHPVRPIGSFYAGDDPVWSDIIDAKIIKLSIYNDCLSKIYKNDVVFITGGIGSGKSTLVMQLAIDKDIDGMKFYFNNITKVKAIMLHSILQKLPGRKCLFIDNLSHNLDAFIFLRDTQHYIIVCADRDINYDMIKHLVKFNRTEILDITELQNIDIQSLCNLARNTNFRSLNTKMSLFEVAYYIWEGKKLSTKIADLITTLSENIKYANLLEFFTLMTYIRSSGISASMDMLLLYYIDDKINYQTIYEYVNSLKSMIDDEDHFTINKDQDFFTLRSKLFAELSLQRLPSNILGEVLTKFIKNVHKDIIVRYDIFMRKGFDADIAMKAFIDIDKGKEFYEKIIKMDNSEYRYQQYALYLFRKKNYKDAWTQIETARNINPTNLAVKNTQAFILFQNNINIIEDIDTVKQTLDETFEVIEQCINKDLRKTFHVITYSENAIRYYYKFREDTLYSTDSNKYLSIALKYIYQEQEINEFISKINYKKLMDLKRDIESIFKKDNDVSMFSSIM